jgi:hypothetical protein
VANLSLLAVSSWIARDNVRASVHARCLTSLPFGRFEDKHWTHEGMSVSAWWFVDNLGPKIARQCKETGFKCVVTGHSLGAGIACITTHLLRQHHVPNAVCWAFACPSCASEELCVEMEGYVTVIVSELDVVPRLSLASFETLRRCVVHPPVKRFHATVPWMHAPSVRVASSI